MAKKIFTYRGKTIEELKQMSVSAFKDLLPASLRRSLSRGFTEPQEAFLKRLETGKDRIKTHVRDIPVLPTMVGKTIGIHNGKEFVFIMITEEMLGHRLGELTYNRRRIQHSAPGIGATRSTGSVSVK